jgi:hypothetical protein
MTQKLSKFTLSIAASAMLIATSVADNTIAGDNKISADRSIRLSKSDKESSQTLTVSPQAESIKTNYSYTQYGQFQVDVGTVYEANNVSNTVLFDASMRLLYAGAKMGTYIGVTKGSDLEKIIVSEGFALDNGRIKLSAALLKRLTRLDFSEYSKTYDEKLTQRSLGAEYAYLFGENSFLHELKTSVTYFDLDGKDLGRISDIIINNASYYDWTRIYGGYRGGSKLLAEMSAVFRVSDSIKATVGMGYDKVTYDAMYDEGKESSVRLATKASLEYRMDDYNLVELYGSNQNTQSLLGGKYTHDFGNAFRGFLSTEKIGREFAPDDTQYKFGLNYTFGADNQHSKLNALFASNDLKDSLSLSELTPIGNINSNNFALSPKKVTKTEHIARVDKTVLGAGDGITVAADGTLSNIYFDNGGFTVTSVDAASDASYLPYLGIVSGKLAIVNILALNAHMASQGLTTGQTKLLNVAVSDTSGGGTSLYAITITKGSVEIMATVQKAYSVTALQKAAFLAGTKTILEINTENGDTTPPAAPTGLSLNSGATYTNSTTVYLDGLTGSGDVAEWYVSESGTAPSASAGGWVSSKPTSYTLSNGDGTKTVYVYVKDAVGNVQSTSVSDTIVLDTFFVLTPGGTTGWADDSIQGPYTLGSTSNNSTIGFMENITSFTNIVIKDSLDNSVQGTVPDASVSGSTATLTITWPASPSPSYHVYIEGVATDLAGNQSIVRTIGDYQIQ